ncbi:MAG: hypothetical protein PWP23_241 [Candidatus Sumerlaeota bacterium]|nr:hypothetical protein [Candidatus Sumerlaeota bacterium]
MALDVKTLRQLVDSDPSDTMLRYVLGLKLFEEDGTPAALQEAALHLSFVRKNDAKNVAAWYVLAQVHAELGRIEDARAVLNDCIAQIDAHRDIDGTDLLPRIEAMLDELE